MSEYPDFAWREAILNAIAHRDSGEGILRMHEKMQEQDLPVPRYDTRKHEVWVTLRNRPDADRRELDADRPELTPVEQDLIAQLGARPRAPTDPNQAYYATDGYQGPPIEGDHS